MSMVKSYTRVISTNDGGSAFEDGELPLGEVPVGDNVPSMLVGALEDVTGVAYCRFAAFGSEAHPASDPQWVIVLHGRIEVEVSDGTARRFGAGDLVLACDTTGTGHITRVIGDEPAEALGIMTSPSH
jgi:Cupin domain